MASSDQRVRDLTRTADRLDALAETAELMGDDDGTARLRPRAAPVTSSP